MALLINVVSKALEGGLVLEIARREECPAAERSRSRGSKSIVNGIGSSKTGDNRTHMSFIFVGDENHSGNKFSSPKNGPSRAAGREAGGVPSA